MVQFGNNSSRMSGDQMDLLLYSRHTNLFEMTNVLLMFFYIEMLQKSCSIQNYQTSMASASKRAYMIAHTKK